MTVRPAAPQADTLVERVLAAMPVIGGHHGPPVCTGPGHVVAGPDRHRCGPDVDIPRLRANGIGGLLWSVHVPAHLPDPDAVVATLEQVDAVYRTVGAHPEVFSIVYTAAGVLRSVRDGRIAALIGVEVSPSLADPLPVLRAFARLGVRYVTLKRDDGAAETGCAIIAELNRLGVLVDLSQATASTQRAVIAMSTAPVIVGRSTGVHGDRPRDLADDELRMLRANGGVAQLAFVPALLSPAVAEWTAEAAAERHRLGLRTPSGVRDVDDRFARWLTRHPCPAVTIGQVADHVDHARELAGVEHLGLGGDVLPARPEGPAGYPTLLRELAVRGWSGADLKALTGRNVLRVLRDAEDVAELPLWPEVAA
ncbi:membrane dipeptidase [Dactylosporangium sp. NPDC005572]|uniref:membrane dipeptidase n=1 Tax=Dactylosporangium sp. NPDC005572 TaxID=3156889 RepID=UPI0033B60368